jgi:hypothetical protein
MTINSNLKGNWIDRKSKFQNFPALTGKLLFFEIGWKNEMLAPLQVKLNKTKDELQQISEAL